MGASATVVCLGTVLAACGTGGGSEGYVAVHRPASSGEAVAPTGDVELVPLEGAAASEGAVGDGSSGAPGSSGSVGGAGGGGGGSTGSGPASASGADGGGGTTPSAGGGDSGSGSDSGAASGSSGTGAPSGGGGGGGGGGGAESTPKPGPAVLHIGDPEREPADKRWCEKVTVGFHNTGGTAVRSGTVTLGTHIIGALGIDWATVESAEKLPAPIAPGAWEEKTWTVCVDAWRVPLGMHVETRDVSVRFE
ncbi:hypothetical protein [Streptomyces phaeochromogenes]|uniref:hypothetical protein n=1 Tax=Streptomyces phaeochromogenes TaxID=1923 RepID=UPI002DD95D8C|nr:hypothetical protein [Streptomyces phaeochromogenes]WRZ30722.1 hypothetical protein OG931_24765 [Streptomyces phaeochromogenes]